MGPLPELKNKMRKAAKKVWRAAATNQVTLTDQSEAEARGNLAHKLESPQDTMSV